MINPADLRVSLSAFSDPSDGEAHKSRDLALMLLECSPAPFSRAQFTPGHITASGLVFAPNGAQILLVHHRRLDRWLQPGGHVEPEDPTVADTARREVIEETGAILAPEPTPRLIGVDVHGIPAKGSEPYHLHHDLLFSFRAVALDLQVSSESRDVLWCHPADFNRYAIPLNMRRAYARIRSTE